MILFQKTVFIFTLTVFPTLAYGQTKQPTTAITPPIFPNGEAALFQYLGENIKFPAGAFGDRMMGGKVMVAFVVNEDGSLSNVKVKRGFGAGFNEEAIRVVKAMPKWIPATRNGQPIKYDYVQPVRFAIE